MNRRGAQLTGPLGGAGMVGLWGASSLIKSSQKVGVSVGASSSTATATISAVNVNHTILLRENEYLNFNTGNGVYGSKPRITLTNSTTVTATVPSTGTGVDSYQVVYVIEFMPGVLKSVQYGTPTIADTLQGDTFTISAVNTAKSLLLYLGTTNSYSGASSAYSAFDIKHWTNYIEFASSTGITTSRPGNTGVLQTNVCVAEFF